MHAASPQNNLTLSHAGFLVVDHKPLAREMVQTALVFQARHVRQTMSVEMAIEILTQASAGVDCVVADWDMLPLGGLELLRMIRCRALPNVDPRMAFVVFTGCAQETALKSAIELDVNGFATAPLSLDKLARAIAIALRRDWLLQDVAHYAAVPCVMPPVAQAEHRVPRPLPGASESSAFAHIQPGAKQDSAAIRKFVLSDVHPGSILARDIRDVRGAVVLRAGRALEPSILDKLRKAAGVGADHYQVWVRT